MVRAEPAVGVLTSIIANNHWLLVSTLLQYDDMILKSTIIVTYLTTVSNMKNSELTSHKSNFRINDIELPDRALEPHFDRGL